MSHPKLKQVILCLLLFLACPAQARQEIGSASALGVSPQFDWSGLAGGSSNRSGAQDFLRGLIEMSQGRSGYGVTGAAARNAAKDAYGAAGYVGTPVKVTLHGLICQDAGYGVDLQALDHLFCYTGQENDENAGGTVGRHFHVNLHKALYKGKNILNYMFDYRAFGPSTEAADLILQEHARARSTEAGAYYKQRELDQKQLQIAASIMQLSMGLAMPATPRGQRLMDSSLTVLQQLVGEKRSDEILAALQSCTKSLSFPKTLANQDLWDMKQQAGYIERIVQTAFTADPVVMSIKKELHHYNRHSRLAMHATGILQTALSIAAFSPTFAAPAADTAYFALMLATGGPEQDKLLREIYLSKRLESRMKVLNEKAHMAIDTYHLALLSENPVLLSCSQSMVRQMSGENTVREVFGDSELANIPACIKLNAPAQAGSDMAQKAGTTVGLAKSPARKGKDYL